MSFEEFQRAMIKHAKEVQGENYVGDDYYLQDDRWTWRPAFDGGETPEEAVDSDMSYWE